MLRSAYIFICLSLLANLVSCRHAIEETATEPGQHQLSLALDTPVFINRDGCLRYYAMPAGKTLDEGFDWMEKGVKIAPGEPLYPNHSCTLYVAEVDTITGHLLNLETRNVVIEDLIEEAIVTDDIEKLNGFLEYSPRYPMTVSFFDHFESDSVGLGMFDVVTGMLKDSKKDFHIRHIEFYDSFDTLDIRSNFQRRKHYIKSINCG